MIRKNDLGAFKRRFERAMDGVRPNEKGCLLWPLAVDKGGYGKISCYFERIGKDKRRNGTIKTHRLAYLLKHGEIPNDLHILHSCDTPSCVNPDHLRVGTHQENMTERTVRGKSYGARPYANRTRIRQLLSEGLTIKEVAQAVGVHYTTIEKHKTRLRRVLFAPDKPESD